MLRRDNVANYVRRRTGAGRRFGVLGGPCTEMLAHESAEATMARTARLTMRRTQEGWSMLPPASLARTEQQNGEVQELMEATRVARLTMRRGGAVSLALGRSSPEPLSPMARVMCVLGGSRWEMLAHKSEEVTMARLMMRRTQEGWRMLEGRGTPPPVSPATSARTEQQQKGEAKELAEATRRTHESWEMLAHELAEVTMARLMMRRRSGGCVTCTDLGESCSSRPRAWLLVEEEMGVVVVVGV